MIPKKVSAPKLCPRQPVAPFAMQIATSTSLGLVVGYAFPQNVARLHDLKTQECRDIAVGPG